MVVLVHLPGSKLDVSEKGRNNFLRHSMYGILYGIYAAPLTPQNHTNVGTYGMECLGSDVVLMSFMEPFERPHSKCCVFQLKHIGVGRTSLDRLGHQEQQPGFFLYKEPPKSCFC